MNEEHKKKIGLANKGRKPSPLAIINSVKARKGKKLSPEHRQKLKENHPCYWLGKKRPELAIVLAKKKLGSKMPTTKGRKHWNWKGGITPMVRKIRNSKRYQMWRNHVFERDDYTCQACGERGGRLNADHELPFSLFPDLIFEILNGRTLCVDCHKKTDTYGKNLAFKYTND